MVKLCLEEKGPVGHEPKQECYTALLQSRVASARARLYPRDRVVFSLREKL